MEKIGIEQIKQSENSHIIDDQIVLIKNLREVRRDDIVMPIRFDTMLLLFVTRGRSQMKIDDNLVSLEAGELLLVLPSQVVSDALMSTDLDGIALAFTTRKVEKLVYMCKNAWKFGSLSRLSTVVKLDEEEVDVIQAFVTIGRHTMTKAALTNRAETVDALLQSFVLFLMDVMERAMPMQDVDEETQFSSADKMLRRYLELLNKHEGRIRSVQIAADYMYVTPKYLSTQIKRACGKTALYWIHVVTCRAIEQQMKYTDKSIKEIAVSMEFTNLSFFARFFREHFGMSPSQYRRSLSHG